MYRWGLSNGSNVKQTEKDAKRIFPKKSGINFICKLYFTRENILLQEDGTLIRTLITKKIGRKSILNKLV